MGRVKYGPRSLTLRTTVKTSPVVQPLSKVPFLYVHTPNHLIAGHLELCRRMHLRIGELLIMMIGSRPFFNLFAPFTPRLLHPENFHELL
jgi:hypothetical protein